MDMLPRETSALLQPHTATAGGLTVGSQITIPPGYGGVVIKDGKTFDTLPPGDYLLDAATLPLLLGKAKPRTATGAAPPLPVAVILVQTGFPASLPWSGQTILSKSAAYGLTYTTLTGRCAVQVADPARFCGAILKAGGKALAAGSVSLGQVTDYFLGALLHKSFCPEHHALKGTARRRRRWKAPLRGAQKDQS